jgi:tetratricopeptide (TPR) repeat protein
MVYVGGTDEGRWVPTLMNETSDGERRIVITQNGLADGTYAEYLRFLYGDRLNALSNTDSDRAFQDYMKDAQKRFEHDQQFPDEPKQVRDNEQINKVDGKIQVSGIVAVMDINERLLRMLMEKNPELSFALQESFPLKGTYADASPLGPIMELRAQDQSSFTPERAAESVNYWRTVADQLRASPNEANGETPLKSYSKLATGQANLFAERGFAESAEQTYRIALGIVPSNVDAVTGLAGLLERTGRAQDARTLVDQFARDFPKQANDVKRFLRSGFIFVQ